jgi:PIN domain nuclease of toxin-antitoxin system
VRLLLDTQIFLWFLDDESRIPESPREAIHAPENTVLVSAAAIWEIAIKASLGRLRVSSADVKRMPHLIESAGFDELPVLARHATGVHSLPLHHRDPFDRLMIAQTVAESLTLVSTDPVMRAYDVALL